MKEQATEAKRLTVPIVLVTLCGVLLAGFFLGGRRTNELRVCGSMLVGMPFISAKAWNDIDDGKSGPGRGDWRKEVTSAAFLARLSKRCSAGGTYSIEVSETGALNINATYKARCSVHGDVEKVKQELGPDEWARVQKLLPASYRE